MNLAQMIVVVKDILTAGGGQNSNIATDVFWSDNEIIRSLNSGQQYIYNAVRRARADYFTRILNTTDPTLRFLLGENFAPSTLAWVPGQGQYTLPPDFVRMVSITDLTATTAADRIRISMSRIEREEFRIIMNESSGNDLIREYYGAIIGIKTLIIRPVPNITRDWQFIYEKKLPQMRLRNTGYLVSLVGTGGNQPTFTVSSNLPIFANVGDQLVLPLDNTLNNNPTAKLIADPNVEYPVIQSVDTSFSLTIEDAYYTQDGNDLVNCPYIIADVSEIPVHHHETLIYWAVADLFKKGPNPSLEASSAHLETFKGLLQNLIDEVESRQGMDRETSQAYLEDTYYGSWW